MFDQVISRMKKVCNNFVRLKRTEKKVRRVSSDDQHRYDNDSRLCDYKTRFFIRCRQLSIVSTIERSIRADGIKKNYTIFMMLITNQGKDTIKLKELFRYRSLTFTLQLFGEIPITRGERSFTSKYTIHLELIRTGVWMFRKKMRLQLCFFFGL